MSCTKPFILSHEGVIVVYSKTDWPASHARFEHLSNLLAMLYVLAMTLYI